MTGVLDSHLLVRKGLVALVKLAGFSATEYCSLRELQDRHRQDQCQLYVLGPNNGDPIVCSENLKPFDLPIIVVLANFDRMLIHSLVKLDVQSILLSTASQEEFNIACRAAIRFRHYFSPAIADVVRQIAIDPQKGILTEREMQILRLISTGITAGEIAEMLKISIHTTRTHKRNLMQKLAVRNQICLINRARELEIL